VRSTREPVATDPVSHVAEQDDALEPGRHGRRSTSGNTGIGLAAVCAARGDDCVLTMPARRGDHRRARGVIAARQSETETTPAAHRRTTGPELWRATSGAVDALVAVACRIRANAIGRPARRPVRKRSRRSGPVRRRTAPRACPSGRPRGTRPAPPVDPACATATAVSVPGRGRPGTKPDRRGPAVRRGPGWACPPTRSRTCFRYRRGSRRGGSTGRDPRRARARR